VSRVFVVAGLFLLSLITYIDRAAISSVRDALASDLALDDQAIGFVFSAFALGYALAQVPSGWLADKLGPRSMLTLIVIAWSVLTAATGMAGTFATLVSIRFLFGIAEAGAFPGCARVFYNWLPSSEHGRANGVIFSGTRLGAAFAFPIMAWLLVSRSWRDAFYLLAIPGIAWAIGWYALFRDNPKQPPPREESAAGPAMPFGAIVRSRPMLLSMAQYFCANFTTFLCLSWMLPYLKQRYSLSQPDAAFYAMWPLILGATAQWAAGFLVDRLFVSGHRAISRSAPAMAGFAISAAGAVAIPFAPNAPIAATCFALAAFGADMTISPSWAFCIDVGGRKSGAVSGSMNMAGNLGSFVSANAFPYLQKLTGAADAYFFLVFGMNILSIVCWRGMRRRA
jgi:ACS family glucarate transporter-like MFS transporter